MASNFKLSADNTCDLLDSEGNHVATFTNYIDAQRARNALNEYESLLASNNVNEALALDAVPAMAELRRERNALAVGLWRAFMWFGERGGNQYDGVHRDEWLAAREALKAAGVGGL